MPVATQPATAPQQTHSARGWVLGILLVLGVIFWHPIWTAIRFCGLFIAYIFLEALPWLIVIAILLILNWLFSGKGGGGGGGSGYSDSWEDGYNAGYDEYNLWHGDDHDGGDWY